MTVSNRFSLAVILGAITLAAAIGAVTPRPAQELDAEAIERASGAQATTTEDGVVRIGWPRDDVQVTIDGMPMKPFAGLGSWAAFMPTDHSAMVMGDTVVFQDEVSPAMDAAFAHDLEITALHNHFFFDEPKVYFMHIGGHGDPEKLAAGVGAVWEAIRQVRQERPEPADRFPGPSPDGENSIDASVVERLLGQDVSAQGGVVKLSIGREASMHGSSFGGSMGLTTWAAFSGSHERATIDGDFAMTAKEVQPVLRALRRAGIHVVALHNHMVGEEPAYYFTHFWGKGPITELTRGFQSALEAQEQARAGR